LLQNIFVECKITVWRSCEKKISFSFSVWWQWAIRGKKTRVGTETDTNTVTSLSVQRVKSTNMATIRNFGVHVRQH